MLCCVIGHPDGGGRWGGGGEIEGGRATLPYISYMGTCRCEGYQNFRQVSLEYDIEITQFWLINEVSFTGKVASV